MASTTGGSRRKSRRAANATARSIRTGSSWKRCTRIADRANQPVAKILQAADVVDDRERRDVIEERVDREVAPERVLFGRAERVVVANQQIGGRRFDVAFERRFGRRRLVLGPGQDVAAERRHFDVLVAEAYMRETKPAADDPAVAEELLDLIGMRVGADVEILRPALEQQIAHAAADEVRDVVELLQSVEHFQRIGIDVPARNRVLRPRDDHRLRHRNCHCTALR